MGGAPPPADGTVSDDERERYALSPPERLTFVRPDGVELVATAWRPEGLERAPVILHAQPYASGCSFPGSQFAGDPYPTPCRPPTSDEFWLDEYHGLPRALVEHGYAFVDLNVRGTGPSGGCLTINGPDERADLLAVIEELGAASWSTGAVGMLGLSYMGTTPLVAVTERPPALKAVMVGGMVTNEFHFYHTPQAAAVVTPESAMFDPLWFGSVVLMPQMGGGPGAAPDAAGRYPERYCPDFLALMASDAALVTEARNASYYLERSYLPRLRDLDAGVLVVHGLRDVGGGMQVEWMWEALEGTPRALALGDWAHEFPDDAMLEGSGHSWPDLPLAWFDHFLRGGPTPEALGTVSYQVSGGGPWARASAWPAFPGEALYLHGGILADRPGSEPLSFRAAPRGAPCLGEAGTWAAAVSDPMPRAVRLAGSPVVWLEVEVDAPAATFAVDLWDVPGDDVCAGTLLTRGAADLRFREDPFRAKDVPLGTPLGVRIDTFAMAWEVPEGHRLAVTVSASGTLGAHGRPSDATVKILPGRSHVLLPTDAGVGDPDPGVAYPPLPLGPA